MNGKFSKTLMKFHKGEKGITGLETAIILIAFVTVAAVLAYSVLSAGIFSSERGKEAVYQGLDTAKSSMQLAGSVIVSGNTSNTNVSTVQFQLKSVLADENIDLSKATVNYQDDERFLPGIQSPAGNVTWKVNGVEATVLRPSEVALCLVDIQGIGGNLTTYESFTIDIIPLTGATVQVKRTLPGEITAIMNLH